VGGALTFNGTSDSISVPIQTLGSAFTLACWCNPTVVNAMQMLFGKDVAGTRNLTMGPNLAAGSQLGLYDFATDVLKSASAMTAGVWQHCAATWNGTAAVLYLNLASTTRSMTFTFGATNLYVGQRVYLNDYKWFGGLIDDVRIYDSALTAAQIASIYNGGNGSVLPYPWLASQRGCLGVLGVAV
jgi:hypothetical protein